MARLLPVSIAPPIFPRLIPNTNLDSEEVLAYELGYRAQATDMLSVDMALFYNVYNDLSVRVPEALTLDPATGTFFIPVSPQNRMDGETYGMELAANWTLTDWWRMYGAYTFLEMQLHRDKGVAASAEAAEGLSPEQQVYLQSSWDLPGNLEFDLTGRFVDRLRGFNPGGAPGITDVIDDYISLDARLAWRLHNDFEIAIVGQNLLDNHHAESGTSPLVRSPLVEIQRGVYGTIVWRF